MFANVLPKVVGDVGPAGGIPSAMNALNELSVSRAKAKYAPLIELANAGSKLAYQQLMGPQFLAKLMGKDSILGGMSENQRNAALNQVVGAGMGSPVGQQIVTNALNNGGGEISPIGYLVNEIKNAFGFNNRESQPASQVPVSQNALRQNPVRETNQYTYETPSKGNVFNPQPSQNDLPLNAGQQIGTIEYNSNNPNRPKTYAENVGDFKGNIKQGEELGKNRAESVKELDDQYQQAVQAEAPIQHLIEISKSPEFMNMRNKIPFFQDKQLQALSKIGTPAEQKLIGDFLTTTSNAVANTVNSFRGRILDKEITLANNMKISPNDTWNTMMGKLASIETFNQMVKQRSRIASQLIQDQHLNKGEALERADKMVDANKIRQGIEIKLNPKPTDADIEYMAKKYNRTPDAIRKQLKAKGLL